MLVQQFDRNEEMVSRKAQRHATITMLLIVMDATARVLWRQVGLAMAQLLQFVKSEEMASKKEQKPEMMEI